MKDGPDIARIAALIGDPARANILTALMSGKALTATELAREAGVTLQTTSGHLAKLERGGLTRALKQGRHKYVSLADDEVARVLEALMGLAAKAGHLRTRTGPRDEALRKARVCYNHLAGDMGTRLYDRFIVRGYLGRDGESLILTGSGAAFVRDFGIDLDALDKGRAPLCRDCLDWSERRAHLAGSLGRVLLTRFEELGWARRDPATRVVHFSQSGESQFDRLVQGVT
ncbi:helix-turn-helix transcriptional regulator [Defluviimonas aestuarii]|uniref:ArsR/SmtB family transcription factor n=1 Tax=Albidovulum aestuarii TaxID=1130726 RepID=UPI00249C51C4|nr:helix-turn-helix transcriptional regulator [Defluviimonas aestuarii]MDI3336726.1 helix-turn-helix transcriptional regulator [Defluviimonas aestuarii]